MKAGEYLIALGSNMRHHTHGRPRDVLAAALLELERAGVVVVQSAPIIHSAPVGPSLRRYANTVAVIETDWTPEHVLRVLQRIERFIGRTCRGQRWSARVLDLDIILWWGGCFAARDLVIPHTAFRQRRFVLGPLREIAGDWRDPITGLTMNQLYARLTSPRPAPR